jgi:hypothetical protein
MAFLTELWLPILLASVLVFVASSVIHMALPYHKSNFKKLPGEDAVLETMRDKGVGPGAYMFPCCENMKEWNSAEMQARREQGPQGILFVMANCSMGKSLGFWFLQSLIISVFVGYLAWESVGAAADYLKVFQIVGAGAFLGYGVGHMHQSIWGGQSWTVTGKFIFDGLIYALVTAGAFGWLWPAAEAAATTAPAGLPG